MATLPQPQSTFLIVNGLRMHYLDWGYPSAPPVVCVHGYTSSAQAFAAPPVTFRAVSTLSPLTCEAMERALGHLRRPTTITIRSVT